MATLQRVISEPLTTQLAAQSQTDQPKRECYSPQFLDNVLSPWALVFSRLRGAADPCAMMPVKPSRQALAGGVLPKENCTNRLP